MPPAVVAEFDSGAREGVCLRCILVDGALVSLAQVRPAAGGLVLREQPGYYLDAFAALLDDGVAEVTSPQRALRCEGRAGSRRYRWL